MPLSTSLAEDAAFSIGSLQVKTLADIRRIFGPTELTPNNQFLSLVHAGKAIKLGEEISTENPYIVRLQVLVKYPFKTIRLAGFVDGNTEPLAFVHEFGPSTSPGSFQLIQIDVTLHQKQDGKCGRPPKRLVFVGQTANDVVYYFVTQPVRVLTSSSECS